MWWNKKKDDHQAHLKDNAARWIATGIISLQTNIALMLQKWEQRCSQRQKKVLLLLFIGCSSTYLLFILANTLLRAKPAQVEKGNPAATYESDLPPSTLPPLLLPKKDSLDKTGIYKH